MSSKMSEDTFKTRDFDNPSILFKLEDVLMGLIGGPFYYNPHYKTYGLQGGECVLDFGCGGGAGSQCLIKLIGEKGHLTCIDLSNYRIRKAEERLKKYPNAECIAGDIRNIHVPDSLFDVISVIHVIHDIPPADRQGTVNELLRTLKTGGKLFIWEPTKPSHGMPAEEIRKLLTEAGLDEAECDANDSKYKGKYVKAD